MLTVISVPRELYNPRRNEFIMVPEVSLELEHSLVAISKWESRWKIPFFSNNPKTKEQMIDYVRCMTICPKDVPRLVYALLSQEDIQKINEYIDDPMTATWFATPKDQEGKAKPKRQKPVTSELIYSWMAMLNIDWSCETWHVNRLLTLIQCVEEQQKPPKKMTGAEIRARNASLNAMRRKALHTKG